VINEIISKFDPVNIYDIKTKDKGINLNKNNFIMIDHRWMFYGENTANIHPDGYFYNKHIYCKVDDWEHSKKFFGNNDIPVLVSDKVLELEEMEKEWINNNN
jgi:hypothetical protein